MLARLHSALPLFVVMMGGCALYGAFDGDYRPADDAADDPTDGGKVPDETEDTGAIDPGGPPDSSAAGPAEAITCADTCPSGSCVDDACVPWVGTIGGFGFSEIRHVDVGPEGEVVLLGGFDGPITVGNDPLTSDGEYDVFVAKLGRSGEPHWAKRIGGPWFDEPTGLAVDENGDIFVSLRCDHVAFPPFGDFGTMGGDDVCVAKYDGSGDLLWVREFGTPSWDAAWDLSVDDAGVYVVGEFDVSMTLDAHTVSAAGLGGFVAKLDKDTGVASWARSFTPTSSSIIAAVTANGSGDIYIAGTFYDHMQLDSISLDDADWTSDVFAAKLDAATGAVVWADHFENTQTDIGYAHIHDIATDGGDVILAGMIDGAWRFGAGEIAAFGMQGFLARIGSDGVSGWQHVLGGPWMSEVLGVDVDSAGHAVFTAVFDGPSASLGARTVLNPESQGFSFQAVLGRISHGGSVDDMIAVGGEGNEFPSVPHIDDSTDNLVFGGGFDGVADFGTGPVAAESGDGFVVSYGTF